MYFIQFLKWRSLCFLLIFIEIVLISKNSFAETGEPLADTWNLDEFGPAAAYDMDTSKYLVVFQRQQKQKPMTADIFGRLIGAYGKKEKEFKLSSLAPELGDRPRMAPDVDFLRREKSFVVVYEEIKRNDPLNKDILGLWVYEDKKGKLHGHHFVLSSGLDVESNPIIACQQGTTKKSRCAIAWEKSTLGKKVIEYKVVQFETLNRNKRLVNTISRNFIDPMSFGDDAVGVSRPNLAYGNGTFLLSFEIGTWDEDRKKQGSRIIGVQYAATGEKKQVFASSSRTSSRHVSPVAAYDSLKDQYLLVWEEVGNNWDYSNDSQKSRAFWGIFNRGADSGFSKPFPIVPKLQPGEDINAVGNFRTSNPATAYNALLNEYLLVWEEKYQGDTTIRLVRVSNDGTVAGSATTINSNNARNPVVTAAGDALTYGIFWENGWSQSKSNSDPDIYSFLFMGVSDRLTKIL